MIIDSARLNGPCSCGREHVMVTKEAVIEAGCMEKLDFYAAKYGLTGRRAVVYDENTYNARNIIHPKAAQEIVLPPENLHANEIAVEQFRRGRIRFTGIWKIVERTMAAHTVQPQSDLVTLRNADAWAREFAAALPAHP